MILDIILNEKSNGVITTKKRFIDKTSILIRLHSQSTSLNQVIKIMKRYNDRFIILKCLLNGRMNEVACIDTELLPVILKDENTRKTIIACCLAHIFSKLGRYCSCLTRCS